MALLDHHQYSVNHRYDSKPFSSRVVDVINNHCDALRRQCNAILSPGSGLIFDDIFADALIRTANELSLANAPEGAILARFVALFKGTIVDYSMKRKCDPHIYVTFSGKTQKADE